MAAEIEDLLFDVLVSEGGSGLGLGLFARRVGEIGGEIAVDNADDRIVFRVRCPAVAPEAKQARGENEA